MQHKYGYSISYATVLRPSSVVVCNVMYCAGKRCVLEQKLPLTAYRKSIV